MPSGTRVLAVAQSPALGGAEVAMLRIARRLPDHGFAVELTVPAEGPLADAAREAGIAVQLLPVGPLRAGAWGRAVAAWPRARRLVRRAAPELVWLNGSATLRLAPALGRGPLVPYLHDAPARAPRAWRSGRFWARTPVVLCNSHALARRLAALGAPDERLRVVHAPVEAAAAAERPAWAGDGAVVGFVGRIEPAKGVDVLLEAFAPVRERHPDVKLVVVGEPVPAGTAPPGVHYAGAVPGAAGLMSWFDVLAVPSRVEAFSLAAAEALAAGTPVVATRSGGPEEFVVPGRTGALVPPGDAPALAEALLRVLDRGPAMAAACRASVEGFAAERVAARAAAAFREALGA